MSDASIVELLTILVDSEPGKGGISLAVCMAAVWGWYVTYIRPEAEQKREAEKQLESKRQEDARQATELLQGLQQALERLKQHDILADQQYDELSVSIEQLHTRLRELEMSNTRLSAIMEERSPWPNRRS